MLIYIIRDILYYYMCYKEDREKGIGFLGNREDLNDKLVLEI